MSLPQTLPTSTGHGKRLGLLVAGGLGLAGVGLAAGLMLRAPAAAPADDAQAVASSSSSTSTSTARPATAARAKAGHPPEAHRAAEVAPTPTQAAALCANCGTVEGVRAVQRKGEGSGVGAVAGGVVGAVVGSQMGGGSGKTAMTVLGAVGGGLAGNEIEKRSKSTTVYEVKVRMDDGSLRSYTSDTAPTPGAAVKVDSQGFHLVQGAGSTGNAPRVVRTGA